MDGTRAQFAFLSLISLFLVSGNASACIGLVAGRVQFNVTQGGSETLQMQIYNACQNQSIDYQAGVRFSAVANQTTPKASISPANGTIGPGAYASLNITVSMPWNATPGTIWHGGAVASEVSNVTSTGGATVEVGVVKQFTATTLVAPIDYRLYAAMTISVIIGAIGGALYYRKATRKSRRKSWR